MNLVFFEKLTHVKKIAGGLAEPQKSRLFTLVGLSIQHHVYISLSTYRAMTGDLVFIRREALSDDEGRSTSYPGRGDSAGRGKK